MALRILESGIQPLGVFDGLDSQVTTVKGGEVGMFTYVSTTGTDQHAKDVDDGYVGTTTKTRPAVTVTLVSGKRPLFLVDDGAAGYGTLFGQVVGSTAGQSTSSTNAGPHGASGSGKLTLWDKPGLYAVTTDACDTDPTTGLNPLNATLSGGAALYATSAGLLTPNVSAAFEAVVVGRFMEFGTNGSLVTTPASLVSALNSPQGQVSQLLVNKFTRAIFTFNQVQ